jgi:glyoxylase-like metal-dependent hydrolase (beta-lactamase superfamily II)
LTTQRSTLVLAPNPSPYTLEGTNTWVLREPGSTAAVVVDPGPLHEGHLAAILAAVQEQGARVAQILLTHGHPDHSESAVRFAELTGAPVRALDPRHRLGDEGLADGDVVDVGGLELRVVGTPGHSGDSLSFLLSADRAMLTGDTVLGRGTTLVAYPDGTLEDYLDSLNLLRDSAARHDFELVLPGHGPVVADALGVLEFYIAHRGPEGGRRVGGRGRSPRVRGRGPGGLARRGALGAGPTALSGPGAIQLMFHACST